MRRKDLSLTEYNVIHTALKRANGNAKKCISKTCTRKSTNYDWALRKGHIYSRDIKSYIQLCRSCHLKYDGVKPKLSGEDDPSAKLNNKKVRVIKHILENKWYGITQKDIAKVFGVSGTTIGLIKRNKNWKHVTI